ncbi:hypothetical protein FB451DRAFT_1172622 [Mycena latifolia]|nr:hypothetical protein FB451DRAFT_1172622 [Mycena latifolia]
MATRMLCPSIDRRTSSSMSLRFLAGAVYPLLDLRLSDNPPAAVPESLWRSGVQMSNRGFTHSYYYSTDRVVGFTAIKRYTAVLGIRRLSPAVESRASDGRGLPDGTARYYTTRLSADHVGRHFEDSDNIAADAQHGHLRDARAAVEREKHAREQAEEAQRAQRAQSTNLQNLDPDSFRRKINDFSSQLSPQGETGMSRGGSCINRRAGLTFGIDDLTSQLAAAQSAADTRDAEIREARASLKSPPQASYRMRGHLDHRRRAYLDGEAHEGWTAPNEFLLARYFGSKSTATEQVRGYQCTWLLGGIALLGNIRPREDIGRHPMWIEKTRVDGNRQLLSDPAFIFDRFHLPGAHIITKI